MQETLSRRGPLLSDLAARWASLLLVIQYRGMCQSVWESDISSDNLFTPRHLLPTYLPPHSHYCLCSHRSLARSLALQTNNVRASCVHQHIVSLQTFFLATLHSAPNAANNPNLKPESRVNLVTERRRNLFTSLDVTLGRTKETSNCLNADSKPINNVPPPRGSLSGLYLTRLPRPTLGYKSLFTVVYFIVLISEQPQYTHRL